jgi:hypothetical protein
MITCGALRRWSGLARQKVCGAAAPQPPSQNEVWLSMMNLLQIIRKLAPWQKIIVVAMLILIVMTWLAVCLILGSYLSL